MPYVTALNAVYKIIKDDPTTTSDVWMNTAPTPEDSGGLCIEVGEVDGTPTLTMGAGVALERQIIEVGVRGEPRSYQTARDELLRVRDILINHGEGVVDGLRIVAIIPLGFVQPIGRDATQREMFVARFEVITEEPTYAA